MERYLKELQRLDAELKKSAEVANACIVIPTYNEASNIKHVLDRVFSSSGPASRYDLHVLIVDDSSPDGTGKAVEKYSKENNRVRLLTRREKEGLGAAYIAGMQHALNELEPDAIIEMDADFSHNPDDIPRLLDEMGRGADMVIGSRYVDGGQIPGEWGWHRRFISGCANLATRTILGIRDVKDCSGGFRAVRSRVLRKIDWEALKVKGYAFQAVLLEEVLHQGGVVKEIPIMFADREEGESKMTMADILEGFTALAGVRTRRILTREEAEATR